MSVTVRLSGVLAERLGARQGIELPDGATVEELIAALADQAGFAPADLGGLAVVADGAFLARDRALADGQQVDVLAPVAGG